MKAAKKGWFFVGKTGENAQKLWKKLGFVDEAFKHAGEKGFGGCFW